MSVTTEGMSPADFAAINGSGNYNSGMWGDGAWWIIVLLLFGWGRNGNGWGGNGNGGGVSDGYILASDFATIQRQLSDGFNSIDNALDRQNAGICDLGYTQLNLTNGINMNMMQGFNALGTQLADCCCKTQSGIERINTQNVMNTSAIQSQINQCCCDNQKDIMQIRFDMATQNCGTLQAIDKLGDRIENRLTQMEVARLNEKLDAERTANAVLQGRIDRAQLRTDIVNDVRPCPAPAYITCNPWAYQANSCNTCGTCGC